MRAAPALDGDESASGDEQVAGATPGLDLVGRPTDIRRRPHVVEVHNVHTSRRRAARGRPREFYALERVATARFTGPGARCCFELLRNSGGFPAFRLVWLLFVY
jgi:hypothetical protein